MSASLELFYLFYSARLFRLPGVPVQRGPSELIGWPPERAWPKDFLKKRPAIPDMFSLMLHLRYSAFVLVSCASTKHTLFIQPVVPNIPINHCAVVMLSLINSLSFIRVWTHLLQILSSVCIKKRNRSITNMCLNAKRHECPRLK